MPQKTPLMIYKETETQIINAINDALKQGLPMFVIEPMLKLIYNETQQQTQMQYNNEIQHYEQQIKAEKENEESKNETPSA